MNERRRSVYVGSGNWGGDTGKIQVFSLDMETADLELLQVSAYSGAGLDSWYAWLRRNVAAQKAA